MAARSPLLRLLRSSSHTVIPSAPRDCIASHASVNQAYNTAFSGSFFQQCRSFVQMRTRLEVADNSGAKHVSCIKVLGGGKHGKIGDIIIASVKDAVPRGKVKKGEVVNCVIVRAATQRQRSDGSEIRFDKNAVVVVNKQGEPIGTRIFGPVPHELRVKNFMKILTLADHVT
ncbi:uncharacterized protein [Physcomitrium patens]|uniref:50S ribosomal protein L14 n=1 Tax=Physcomitrium patens TaxID=3218 RepID=A0A2K1LBP7_PHYPA|nr:uncharacterized protein LOC112279481 [Physcomitrium patens]PNR63449.1 hypothetical protein PHYPA_001875 [Physcomitrium patens]|eukprot:XP_024369732.1 uncharacterized protein LOC112279481 [Physcomitrella patens]